MKGLRGIFILVMMAFNATSATFPALDEKILEAEGVPVTLVLRRYSETEEEGPITIRSSELELDEQAAFADESIFNGTAVGSIKIETSDSALLIKELSLVPFLAKQGFAVFIQQVLQSQYPGNKVTFGCPI